MANKIIINDCVKTYDIENQDGKYLGSFSFNPSDINIVKRHSEVVISLEELSKKMEQKSEDEHLDKILKDIDAVIYEKINYLLNADVAETFFSIMGPLSPLENGQFFIETVLDAIGQAIQAETGERVKKINGKIGKYTSKYHG